MTLLNYREAQEAIADDPNQISADYYRTARATTFPLLPQDKPEIILAQFRAENEDADLALMEALDRGYVQYLEAKTPDGVDFEYFNIPEHYHEFYRSHKALQIAFPDRYRAYFKDGNCHWDWDDPEMTRFMEMIIARSAQGWKEEPDFYVPLDDKGKPIKERKKVKGFREWVKACQEHKKNIANAWEAHSDARAALKEAQLKGKAWRDTELDRLRAEMSAVSAQYNEAISSYEECVRQTKVNHKKLKEGPKPQREDFE